MKLTSNFLSNLRINTDKNWLSYNIYNLGRGNINLGRNQPLSPYVLFPEDIGLKWRVLSSSLGGGGYGLTSCGGGLLLYSNLVTPAPLHGHVFRSTDYGVTWTDLGSIIEYGTQTPFPFTESSCFTNCGIGIVLLGATNSRHIYRSTDYGATWTDLGLIIGAGGTYGNGIFSISYCGGGKVIAGTYDGHVFRSTDYGANWTDLGAKTSSMILFTLYLGQGVAVFTTYDKHIFRSTDYGATWTDLGTLAYYLKELVNCGNGVVVGVGALDNKHVFRSTDYGLTWTDVGALALNTGGKYSMVYCGNGLLFIGTGAGAGSALFKSYDYGVSWIDTGYVDSALISLVYCYNGDLLSCDYYGTILIADNPFKLFDMPPVGGGGEIMNPVMFMDFWSDNLSILTLADGELLPDVDIDSFPSTPGISILKVVAILKYGQKEDDSGAQNSIATGSVQCKESTAGTYVDAILFTDGEALIITGNAKEGGDVHVGNIDIQNRDSNIKIKLDATGSCTINSKLSGVTTAGASLYLLDVQVGIRVYFQFTE